LLVLFSLYSVLLTEGNILDPYYEIWEEQKGVPIIEWPGGGGTNTTAERIKM
jgi:hypothetical protein